MIEVHTLYTQTNKHTHTYAEEAMIEVHILYIYTHTYAEEAMIVVHTLYTHTSHTLKRR